MSDVTRWQELYADYSREYERGETDMTFESWMIEQTIEARRERDKMQVMLEGATGLFIAVATHTETMTHRRQAGEFVAKLERLRETEDAHQNGV